MPELTIRKSIQVNASAGTVWRTLTDNTLIPQYMFGCSAETDWTPGSPLLWKGVADGKIYVKGTVVTFDPPRRLEYTVIDPNNPDIPDEPENYLTMTFLVKPDGNRCHLDIVQGDFSKVAQGEQRYRETTAGDDTVLQTIKKLAEDQEKLSS